jgi:hypothetical protein
MPRSDTSLVSPPIVADTRDGNPRHPRQGEALRARKEKLARMDFEQAIAVVVGRDRVLAEVARLHGEQRAIDAAEIFGFNPQALIDRREQALQQVRQTSRRSGDWGPLHDDELMQMITSGAPDADVWAKRGQLLQREAARAQARADQQARETGPATALQKQVSTVNPKLSNWGPDHDERVTAAILSGASLGRIAAIRQEVAQEYRDAEEMASQGKTMADVEAGQAHLARRSAPPLQPAAPGSTT